MRTNKTLTGLAIAVIAFLAAEVSAADSTILKTQKDKENYTTGVTIVRNLKHQGGSINLDIVIKGMIDELTGDQLLMTEADIRQAAASIQGEITQKQMKAEIEVATPSRDDGSAAPQDQRHEKTNEQVDQSGLLATGSSPGMNATALNNSPGTGQASPDQKIALAPNGSVLSRRNQAKLGVAEMKSARAKAFESRMSQSE